MGGKVKGSAVKKVVIEVYGGVAYCNHKDRGVEVFIIDHDTDDNKPVTGVYEANTKIGEVR